MPEKWKPDFVKLGRETKWPVYVWQTAWDALDEWYRKEYYWPALVGMVDSFDLPPYRCAEIMNTVPGGEEANDGPAT